MKIIKEYEKINSSKVQGKSVEDLLVMLGFVSDQDMKAAIEEKKKSEKKIQNILIDNGTISEMEWIRCMGVKYRIPLVNLSVQNISPRILRYMSEKNAYEYTAVPIAEGEYSIYVATNNPLRQMDLGNVIQSNGKTLSIVLATKKDIDNTIAKHYLQQSVISAVGLIESEFQDVDEIVEDETGEELGTDTSSQAVVNLVRTLLEQACVQGASDIHIEPLEHEVVVRLRVDGILVETMRFKKAAYAHVSSRVKVLSGMDIAEKRIPQDGRMQAVVQDKRINMRVSSLPIMDGEKIVIRILGSTDPRDMLSISDLNLEDYNQALLDKIMAQPTGVILITGPTGSGKSTTVYAMLKQLFEPTVNIITIEDPIERILQGVNQVQVNQKAGLTFASGLRSMLRQDPDIIMVGEIRDEETASIALQAAITGHLVIATLHTNDASSAFMRLMDMGVEPYIVASTISGVVAQRLVRKICKNCKTEYEPSEVELIGWKGRKDIKFYKGKGCPMCNGTGYKGRVGVYEIITTDEVMQRMIVEKADNNEINRYLVEHHNMKNIVDNAIALVERGETTIEEYRKVSEA